MNNQLNWDFLFEYQFKILKFFGYRLKYESNFESIFAKFIAFYFCVVSIGVTTTFMVFYMVKNMNNLENIVESIAPVSSCIGMMVKLTSLYFYRKHFDELIRDLIECSNKGNLNNLFPIFFYLILT